MTDHKDLIETARRAEGSEMLPKISFGRMNAEVLLLRLADALEAATAEREELESEVARLREVSTWIVGVVDKNLSENNLGIHRLSLDGEYYTGPAVDWAHMVLIGLRDIALRALKGEPK